MFEYNSFENLQNDIESICGENKSEILQTVTEDNPDYVFTADPEFNSVRLYDSEANTVLVSSFEECSHYVSGGWGNLEPTMVNNNSIYLGVLVLMLIVTTSFLLVKKNVVKNIFELPRKNLSSINKSWLIKLNYLALPFFILQSYLLFPYVKNRALNMKKFIDEYIVLTSNVEFFNNLNYDAGSDWGGNFSIYLTSGPLSAVGSVIGWNFTENFTISRISNFYWVLFIQLAFIYILGKKFKLDFPFLLMGASTFILLIPWWYGSLYSLGEIASMLFFTNSIFLYSKNIKIAMVFFGISIFFGKILTLLPFIGFYLFSILKNKNLKKSIEELSYFLVPLIIWLIFVHFKFENGNIFEYLSQQIKAITIHQSSGVDNVNNNIDSFWSKLNESEFKTWNNYDIFRLLLLPIIYSLVILKNYRVINDRFGNIASGIVGSILFPYLWFWILSDTKWMRYSQHFTVIILISGLVLLSSDVISKKSDLFLLSVLIISFIDDQKNFIIIFAFTILIAQLILSNNNYLQFNKYFLAIVLTLNFLIAAASYDLDSKQFLEISDCKESLLNINCKNKYLNN
jgi:hypothetical protein